MLEVPDALEIVLHHAVRMPRESSALSASEWGRVLATDVLADRDSPPFDKSLRDGYAVRAEDCVGGTSELSLIEEVQAGAVPQKRVCPGECSRIFTGAPLPDGADAVVMQEDTASASPGRIRITDATVKRGKWVFARGQEMRTGDVVLPAGTVLNSAALGILANVGRTTADLIARPRVGVLATGNELVEADASPGPGQIRNSNGPMLSAQAARAGAAPSYLGIAGDTRDALRERIREGLETCDVLLIAGGVSVGAYDLVPDVLGELGVVPHFRQVRMKPGKPLLFGTREKTLVFGLPGNPVSSFVGFELFVRPALRLLAGHKSPGPFSTNLPLAEPLRQANDRPTFHPAKLELTAAGWSVRPLPWGGAPDLRGLQPADALLALPAADSRFESGQLAPVILLDH